MNRIEPIARVHRQTRSLPYYDDPLKLYQQLTRDKPDSMLLESAEIDSKDHLKSIILSHAALAIRCDGSTLSFEL